MGLILINEVNFSHLPICHFYLRQLQIKCNNKERQTYLCVIFKMTSGMEWKRDARAAEIDRRRMISSH